MQTSAWRNSKNNKKYITMDKNYYLKNICWTQHRPPRRSVCQYINNGMSHRIFYERYLSFVLLYFDFWTILVHGSFDDSSHFVLVNINILTHTTSRLPMVSGAKIPLPFSFLPIPSHFDASPTGYELTLFPGPLSYPLVGENPRNKVQTNWRWELNIDQGKHVYERFTGPTTKLGLRLPNKVTNKTKKENEISLYVFHQVFWDLLRVLSERINQETVL